MKWRLALLLLALLPRVVVAQAPTLAPGSCCQCLSPAGLCVQTTGSACVSPCTIVANAVCANLVSLGAPCNTVTPTNTSTQTPTVTNTTTPTPTITNSPTVTPTFTQTGTATETPTPAPTATPNCGTSPTPVTNTSDDGPGSLRRAVFCCNGNTIAVPAGTYVLTTSEMDVNHDCTINGAGIGQTIIDDNGGPYGAFSIGLDGLSHNVVLRGFTQKNSAALEGESTFASMPIEFEQGTLLIDSCEFRENTSDNVIYANQAAETHLTMQHSSFVANNLGDEIICTAYLPPSTAAFSDILVSGNVLGTRGGGWPVFSCASGAVTIDHITVENNDVDMDNASDGGFVNVAGPTAITSSSFRNNSHVGFGVFIEGGTYLLSGDTFSGNTGVATGYAALIYGQSGTAQVVNSTLQGNIIATGSPGGIWNQGATISVINSTVSGNQNAAGGTVGNVENDSGTITFSNSIVAGGLPSNCSGTIGTSGPNVEDGTDCGFTIQNANPLLSPLANDGGPTQTMALQGSSPARNAGDDATCAAAPVNGVDQRGDARPGTAQVHCSIGAFEAQNLAPTPCGDVCEFGTPGPCCVNGDCGLGGRCVRITPTVTPTAIPTDTATETPTAPTATPTLTPPVTQTPADFPHHGDPCGKKGGSKATLTLSTTTSAQLLAAQAGKRIYICGADTDFSGSGRYRYVAGTGTLCATNQRHLTGNLMHGQDLAPLGSLMETRPGDAFCVTITGGSGTLTGSLTYVQGP